MSWILVEHNLCSRLIVFNWKCWSLKHGKLWWPLLVVRECERTFIYVRLTWILVHCKW